MNVAIEKAYLLKSIGGKDVYDDLERIKKQFLEIRAAKIALNDQMASVKDSKEYQELANRLKAVEAELKKVKAQYDKLVNSQKEQEALDKRMAAQAKQASADKIADARAATEAQKQETEKRKQAYEQERADAAKLTKDLKALQLQRAQARGAQPAAATGSYNDIARQYKTALAHYKATVDMNDHAALKVAQEDLMRLKTQLDAFNRSLTQDKVLIGEYTSGVMNAFKKMGLGHLISDQVNTAKASLHTLNTEFDHLKQQLDQIRATGVGSLDAVERQLIENRQAAMELSQQLNRVETELKGVGGIGKQMVDALKMEFGNLKQHVLQLIIGFVGFQQLINGIRSSVRINYELSDSFADIKNRIKGTDEEVQSLVNSLRQLDTRTGIKDLVDIAAIVSKKGVAKYEIAEVTQAIDNLRIALGPEMGADIHETVSSLVKLVNLFSDDHKVSAKNIEQIGGVFARLSTSGVSTGAWMIDFAERMGSIRGITGFTIDKVLGLAAALEELGQRSETSSTALSQIIVRLFTETEKYGKIVGMTKKQFESLLSKDVLGAFVMVAERLKGNAAEMEAFFENTVDMHLRGARAIGVIGDIAGNVEYARKRMDVAVKSMKENNVVTDMAREKQQNFAASVDRVKKAWELLASSKGVQEGLKAGMSVVESLIKMLPTLIALGKVWLIGWVLINRAMLQTKIIEAASTVIRWGYATATAAATLAQQAYAASVAMFTGTIRVATAAQLMFNAAIARSPAGAAIVAIFALVGAFGALAKWMEKGTEGAKAYSRAQLDMIEINKRANSQTADTVSKVTVLTKVLNDRNTKLHVAKRALNDLIAIAPEYLEGLTLENIKMKEGKDILDAYIKSLKEKAQFEAAQALQSEKQKKKIELDAMEYSLAQKMYSGEEMTDEEKKYAPSSVSSFYRTVLMPMLNPGSVPSQMARFGVYAETIKNVQEARKELEAEIATTDKVVEKLYGKQAENAANDEKKKADYKAKKDPKGTKLTVEEYEEIKLINAARDRRLTALRTAYMEQDAAKKLYNGRMIDNERAFQEEMQKIEETALRKKISFITGNKAAEQQARAAFMLDLLESQKKYADIYYKDDVDKLKAEYDKADRAAKGEMDNVMDSPTATPQEKAAAKYKYYNGELERFGVFMKQMDGLEKQYNEKSRRNAQEREDTAAGIERRKNQSLHEINQEYVNGEYQKLEDERNVGAKNHLLKKIENTKDVFQNEDMRPAERDEAYNKVRKQSELEFLAFEESIVEKQLKLTERLYSEKLMQGREYVDKVKDYNDQLLDIVTKRHELESEKEKARQEDALKIRQTAVQIGETIATGILNNERQRDAIEERKQDRTLQWQRQKMEAQAQSAREKDAIDRAMAMREDQMERERAEKKKKRAIADMGIEYAAAALRIVALNIGKGPAGWAAALKEEAVLAATYATKIAMASSMPTFERGGVIGGRSHANGGTPITIEAERDELAIINKRSARDNRTVTITGTPKQIASGVNALGGGVDFAPGWSFDKLRMTGPGFDRYMGRGWQANGVKVPQFIGQYYAARAAGSMQGQYAGADGNRQIAAMQDQFAAQHAEIMALTGKVGDMQVILNPHAVSGYNYEYSKSVNVGTI